MASIGPAPFMFFVNKSSPKRRTYFNASGQLRIVRYPIESDLKANTIGRRSF